MRSDEQIAVLSAKIEMLEQRYVRLAQSVQLMWGGDALSMVRADLAVLDQAAHEKILEASKPIEEYGNG